MAQINNIFEQLVKLTAEDPNASKNINVLKDAAKKKYAELKTTIDLRGTKGFDAARQIVITDYGKNQMEIIRRNFTQMYVQEAQTLMHQEWQEDFRSKQAVLWLIYFSGLAIAFHLGSGLITINFVERERKAREALADSENKFRTLVSAIRDYAIFMLGPKGEIRTWNQGAEQIYGYKSNEIINEHFSCFYNQEDKNTDRPMHNLALAKKFGNYEEERLAIHKDGSQFWIEATIVPINDSAHKLTGFAKVSRDITEQKRMTDKLREQASLLDLSRDAILVRDLNGKIKYWNRGAEKMYGYTEGEASGKISHELLKTEFPFSLQKIEKELLAKGYWEGEVIHFTAAGHGLVVASRHTVKNDLEGNPIAVLEINSDITIHKQAEERESALIEMNRVNNELEQFATVASHDLQEPLRGIAGCLQILEKKHKNKLDAEALELIKIAIDGSFRMSSLIADLLTLSRVSKGDNVLEKVNLNLVLQEVLKNIETNIKERDAIITYHNLPTLTAEKTLLMQLFQNLLSNAIKFCPGKIPEIEINAKKYNNKWLLSVGDNGIGFAKEHKEKIFKAFKRLHSKDEYPGTGIGLAICKKIVERHGGKIWAESEPAKGTTFYFTLTDFEQKI